MCKVSLAVTIKIIIFLPSHKHDCVGERGSRGGEGPRDTSRDLRAAVTVKDVWCWKHLGRVMSGLRGCLSVGTVEIKAPGNLGLSQSSNLPTLTSRPLQHQTVRPRTILPGCRVKGQRNKRGRRTEAVVRIAETWVLLESLSCIMRM